MVLSFVYARVYKRSRDNQQETLINITILAEEDIKLMAEFGIAPCKTAGLPAIPAIRKVLGCSKNS